MFDIIIVGGGMVGASLALALKNTSLDIAVIEQFAIDLTEKPSDDNRGIALSYGSQRIFESIGIWPDLNVHCTAITDIHVSDRGHFGVTRISAKEENVPALGQVITAHTLGKVLHKTLLKQHNTQLFYPNKVTQLSKQDSKITVTLNDNQQLSAKLLIAADGTQSTIRRLLGLSVSVHDYQQMAITANITTEYCHNGCAFERFTDTGPIALLPLSSRHCNLVWTITASDEMNIMSLPDHMFLSQLQSRFGYRLGQFTQVSKRKSYPLKLIQTNQPIQQRIALIGNAAHSLHPIAGQGFNLSLRDVAALADVLSTSPSDCGNPHLLNDYKKWQQCDQTFTINSTQMLINLFSNNYPLLGHLRGLGLTLVDGLPPIKHWLSQKSMGLTGRHTKLARGLSS